MRVIFLGTGEALDENTPNSSHLILSRTKLLLDCGFTAPFQLWKYNTDQEFLDAVYISHQHADHFFGLPALLIRMVDCKRKNPPTIICQKYMIEPIKNILNLAYRSLIKFKTEIPFITAEAGKQVKLNELTLDFEKTTHFMDNLAIRIDDGKNIVCYSGDGDFNKETEELYRNADLLIHETYKFEEKMAGHGDVREVIEMAKKNKVKCLALTHINRDERRKNMETMRKYIRDSGINVLIPKPLDEYNF